jgi:hypothetical protein
MYWPTSSLERLRALICLRIWPRKTTLMVSANAITSSSSKETRRMALPNVALFQDLLMNVGDGTNVQAPRRLHKDQKVRVKLHFTGDDGFCWLPPLMERVVVWLP